MRKNQRMGTLTGTLPYPEFGSRIAAKTRVDYQNTPEGALVQRAQSGDEGAFREIVDNGGTFSDGADHCETMTDGLVARYGSLSADSHEARLAWS